MKNYKKLLIVALFLGASCFSANAQIRLGAGLMTGAPMGDLADFNSFGIGAGVSGEYMVTDNIGAGLQVGFMSFSANEDFDGLDPLTMIPVHAFGNYHFMPDEEFNFYAGLGLGMNMVSQTVLTFDIGNPLDPSDDKIEEETQTNSGFAIVPRVGVNYMFSDELGLDFNIGYSILNITPDGADESVDFSYIPINLGIVYVLD